MATNPYSILEYICMIEESMAVLYTEYAQCFPEYAFFWQELADAEQQHASLVIEMIRQYELGALTIQAAYRDESLYQALLSRLNAQAKVAETRSIHILDALQQARELERCFVEQHLTDVFTTEHEGLAEVLATLARDTWHHTILLDQMYLDYLKSL